MLSGKKALVTGASKGVGAAIAEALAREGAHVCVVARSEGALSGAADACRHCGAAGFGVHPCNLSDPRQVDSLAADLLSLHGCLDVLVHCAASYPDPGKLDFLEGDPQAWDAALRLNCFAAMRLTRLLAPSMAEKGAGHIVSLGSVAGLKGVADEGSYAATKWALRGWSTACYEGHCIKVTLIEPAHLATDMAAVQGGTRFARMKPELMLTPEDVAQAALLPFRLGPDADPVEVVLNRMQTPYEA